MSAKLNFYQWKTCFSIPLSQVWQNDVSILIEKRILIIDLLKGVFIFAAKSANFIQSDRKCGFEFHSAMSANFILIQPKMCFSDLLSQVCEFELGLIKNVLLSFNKPNHSN